MKPVLKLGQTLYSLNVGNACRRTEQKLTPCEVSKIGRKYFEIIFKDHWRPIQFHIDTWSEKTEYTSSYCLYTSPQEWEDEKKSEAIYTDISKNFGHGRNRGEISLDNLIKIRNILESK